MDTLMHEALSNIKAEKDKRLYDDHRTPHYDVTVPQLSLFIIWCGAISLFIFRVATGKARLHAQQAQNNNEQASETLNNTSETAVNAVETKTDSETNVSHNNERNAVVVEIAENKLTGNARQEPAQEDTNKPKVKLFSAPVPPPTFDQFLGYVILFGMVMVYYFLCDYRKMWPNGERIYIRDTFLFLVFLFFLVACAFTIKPTADKILNRDQTEEWKGWMQVMFVWYHYYAAAEWYNWIRIYIAAYVWMTGFGNFSFFYIRKDYSAWRLFKMLFRLNFLVIFVCLVVSNEYMLYYICAMHTYWFLSVYAMMGVLSSWNYKRHLMPLKFVAYAVINAIIFDVPGLSEKVFTPVWFILGYHDKRFSLMHEWAFRGGLDHWVAFIGMLCAYNYPHFEAFIKWLESTADPTRNNNLKHYLGKLLLVGAVVVPYCIWHGTVLSLPKFQYNRLHPFTSFIPIITFIVLRNLIPALRTHYIGMFARLGQITLETYLSQLHIYLQSNAKHLLLYMTDYPLLNFALATIVYLILSKILFHVTLEFSAYLIPKDYKTVGKNVLCVLLVFGVTTVMAVAVKYIVGTL